MVLVIKHFSSISCKVMRDSRYAWHRKIPIKINLIPVSTPCQTNMVPIYWMVYQLNYLISLKNNNNKSSLVKSYMGCNWSLVGLVNTIQHHNNSPTHNWIWFWLLRLKKPGENGDKYTRNRGEAGTNIKTNDSSICNRESILFCILSVYHKFSNHFSRIPQVHTR